MRRLRTLMLVLLALGVWFAGQPAHAQPRAEALLDRLEATYRSDRVLHATVTQTVTSPYAGTPSTTTGTITAQGDRYRVELPRQTVVTDGETVWVYNAAREQVLVSRATDDEVTLTPTDLFRLADDYEATLTDTVRRDGRRHYVLRLVPKDPSALYREITLWLRAEDAVATRIEATDVNDATAVIELHDVRFAASAEAGLFTFEAPEGAEVVDLRS